MRRIFIGDIQGCRDELEELLAAVAFDPAADELQPVGDFVNRGPDSLGTLRLLRSLGARGVLGNHDLHLLQCASGKRVLRPGDTFQAVLAADDCGDLLAWLARRPFIRSWPDLYLVHAGLNPTWDDPMDELEGGNPLDPGPARRFAVSVRHCDESGRLPSRGEAEPPPPFRPWHTFYRAGRHDGRSVVFGHWAAQGLWVAPHLRGLDSGCVWGGKLSAWIAEEDRVVQVPARRAYASIASG